MKFKEFKTNREVNQDGKMEEEEKELANNSQDDKRSFKSDWSKEC